MDKLRPKSHLTMFTDVRLNLWSDWSGASHRILGRPLGKRASSCRGDGGGVVCEKA